MKKLLIVLFALFLAFPASASTISDGAIVKTDANPDIYIVKYSGGKMYKRVILNPLVFQSYGHLKWENVLTIPESELKTYKTSDLVKVDGFSEIYQLKPNGDIGDRFTLLSTKGYDLDSVHNSGLSASATYSKLISLNNELNEISEEYNALKYKLDRLSIISYEVIDYGEDGTKIPATDRAYLISLGISI